MKHPPSRVGSATVTPMIVVTSCAGDGTEINEHRTIAEFWTQDGCLKAVHDPLYNSRLIQLVAAANELVRATDGSQNQARVDYCRQDVERLVAFFK